MEAELSMRMLSERGSRSRVKRQSFCCNAVLEDGDLVFLQVGDEMLASLGDGQVEFTTFDLDPNVLGAGG
jgi:hypothetical protein